jgi:4-hydroxy-tetrahydrodipicolinate reductase
VSTRANSGATPGRTYRVVQWSTGNVGRHAIAGIDARPDLELVGVWVSNPDKVGKDAGELAGLGRNLGVAATNDADALFALRPDCIVHTAMADDRMFEALADLERFLRAGINVVSSSPVFLQFPDEVVPDDMVSPVRDAATAAGVSIWVNGVDPGFANDWLPLVLTSVSERIDEVRCLEVLNYATYNQPMVLFDIMGFGRPLDDVPFLLQPTILTTAWGSVVRQIAAGLDVELDGIEEHYERLPAPEAFEIASGTIHKGTAAALRFEVRGMHDGRAVVVLEHVTRLRDDLGPDWPQPAGHGCYRVVISGEPNYTLDLQLLGSDGDHNTAGLKATAMRLVNAVPAVVEAEAGLLSALDLPLITGRGLVS